MVLPSVFAEQALIVAVGVPEGLPVIPVVVGMEPEVVVVGRVVVLEEHRQVEAEDAKEDTAGAEDHGCSWMAVAM